MSRVRVWLENVTKHHKSKGVMVLKIYCGKALYFCVHIAFSKYSNGAIPPAVVPTLASIKALTARKMHVVTTTAVGRGNSSNQPKGPATPSTVYPTPLPPFSSSPYRPSKRHNVNILLNSNGALVTGVGV